MMFTIIFLKYYKFSKDFFFKVSKISFIDSLNIRTGRILRNHNPPLFSFTDEKTKN